MTKRHSPNRVCLENYREDDEGQTGTFMPTISHLLDLRSAVSLRTPTIGGRVKPNANQGRGRCESPPHRPAGGPDKVRDAGERRQFEMANSDKRKFPVVAPPHQNNATGQPAKDSSNVADDDDYVVGWIQALSRREKQRLKKDKKAKQTLERTIRH
ncbi:hypothetical protein HPB48_022952 [Haemaphysalis longicornis]|uniref:Uncharacterized protein n=1 Tax=Haemaphysalis longicornis TaxID=44386 RepID=A0A9J6FCW1_HAELO|nr:hypothetical protein HPB48_022952 [Haemaphysalis longicornis]